MYAKQFLHKLLLPVTHFGRLKVLTSVVLVTIKTKKLQLTNLGRALDEPIQERSCIRKLDRLLGNHHLQQDASTIYESNTKLLIGNKKRPIIIVDWTKVPNCDWYILRAALATEGRALTLYEEMHSKKKEGNPVVHHRFLKKLSTFLKKDCKPIIVTDAGFKNPWFKRVLELGWDFIGRVRGLTKYSEDGNLFVSCRRLHAQATGEIKYLGEKILARKNPMKLACYVVKQKLKGRTKKTKKGKRSQHKDSLNYSRAQREPWLLVTSLTGFNRAKKINKIYKRRMTIEEGFRDLKSSRYGFSLADSRTRRVDRYIVFLLLALLAGLIAWLTGKIAEERAFHYQYQANSIKHRRVLSFFYLGCQILRKKHKILKILLNEFLNVCTSLDAEFHSI